LGLADFYRYTADMPKQQPDYFYLEPMHADRFQLAVNLFDGLETCITRIRRCFKIREYLSRTTLYSCRFTIASRNIASSLLRQENVQKRDAG
jgi:hypothetical protein